MSATTNAWQSENKTINLQQRAHLMRFAFIHIKTLDSFLPFLLAEWLFGSSIRLFISTVCVFTCFRGDCMLLCENTFSDTIHRKKCRLIYEKCCLIHLDGLRFVPIRPFFVE